MYQGCTVTKTPHLPIRYFLALLWAHPILHISRIRVNGFVHQTALQHTEVTCLAYSWIGPSLSSTRLYLFHFFVCNHYCNCWGFIKGWHDWYPLRWPHSLCHGTAVACLLGLRVRIPSGVWDICCVVCRQVEVSGAGWSPVQRSPTVCGVSECAREVWCVWVCSWSVVCLSVLVKCGVSECVREVWCVWVCSWSLDNEEALAYQELLRRGKSNIIGEMSALLTGRWGVRISVGAKRFFSSLKCPEQLWCLLSLRFRRWRRLVVRQGGGNRAESLTGLLDISH